jgi:hypothetical protein
MEVDSQVDDPLLGLNYLEAAVHRLLAEVRVLAL